MPIPVPRRNPLPPPSTPTCYPEPIWLPAEPTPGGLLAAFSPPYKNQLVAPPPPPPREERLAGDRRGRAYEDRAPSTTQFILSSPQGGRGRGGGGEIARVLRLERRPVTTAIFMHYLIKESPYLFTMYNCICFFVGQKVLGLICLHPARRK
jgi:hypothetical protein